MVSWVTKYIPIPGRVLGTPLAAARPFLHGAVSALNSGERCRRLNKPFPWDCRSSAAVTGQAGAGAPRWWKGEQWGRIAVSFVQSSLVMLAVLGFRGLGSSREEKKNKQRSEKGLEKESKIFLKLCNINPRVMNLQGTIRFRLALGNWG